MRKHRGTATAALPVPPPQQHAPARVPGDTAAVPWPRVGRPVAALIPTRGSDTGAGYPIRPGRTTIGRDRGCDLVLDDPTISRHHAELHHDGREHYLLVDTGALNGLYVNRARTARAELAAGDEIWIGTARFLFHSPVPAEARA